MMQTDSHPFPGVFFALTGILLLALLAVLGYEVYQHTRPEDNPLRYPVPQQIQGSATIKAGDPLIVKAQKCNDSDGPVLVEGTSWWKRRDAAGLVPYITGQRVADSGCQDFTFTNVTPTTLAPGTWRLEGRDCIKPNVCALWFSKDFQVVP